MNHQNVRQIFIKAITFHLVFVVLHFAYDWLPVPLVAVFSGTSEAVFQHMKIGFFAYSLVNLGEWVLLRRRKQTNRRFLYARLLSNNLIAWLMFFWYLAPAIMGKPMPNNVPEIIYANVMLLIFGVTACTFECEFEQIDFSAFSRVALWAWYGLTAFLLVAFTFSLPWAGFFVE